MTFTMHSTVHYVPVTYLQYRHYRLPTLLYHAVQATELSGRGTSQVNMTTVLFCSVLYGSGTLGVPMYM